MKKARYVILAGNLAAMPWTWGWATYLSENSGSMEGWHSLAFVLAMIHLNLVAWPYFLIACFCALRKRNPPPF